MDRRTFLKSVGVKGMAAMTASVVGTEMLAAGDIPGEKLSEALERKVKANRLPEDLNMLVDDISLLSKPRNLTVACYTFPNYHVSALHNKIYGPNWTEYNLVRSARPWFSGHAQPRGPLLGELDESKPETWEKYNELCKQSGIDVLIWDWYWYNNEPCLHEALENGFLRASNKNDVKFACMWTNHPWYVLYPTAMTNGHNVYPPSFRPADSSLKECWQSLSYIISRYCHLENYWRIDDKPVICIWDPNRLEKMIGMSQTKQLFAELVGFAKKLGHKGLHFHSSGFYSPNSKEVGYNTAGSYNPFTWVADNYQPKNVEFPDYGIAAADVAFKLWPKHHHDFDIPYLPSLSPGWDSTPRYIPPLVRPDKPNRDTWPGCVILEGENPASFKALVQAAFAYLNKHKDVPPIPTIACFNEWTEGHYLLPDNRFGYGMLDALAEALGKGDNHLLHGK